MSPGPTAWAAAEQLQEPPTGTISDIPLYCGDDNNVITITAKDAANNAASATLTIDVSPCPVEGLGL